MPSYQPGGVSSPAVASLCGLAPVGRSPKRRHGRALWFRLGHDFVRFRVVPIIGSFIALSACMVGPNFETPSSQLADHYLSDNAAAVVAGPASSPDWWENFNDPVLTELIHIGYQNNLSLQVAGLRILQARAQLAATVGDLYPQSQALAGSYTHDEASKGSPTYVPGTNPDVNIAEVGFTASWEIDFWGKYRRAVQANDAQFLGSISAYDAALVTLTADIAQAYIAIRTLETQIQVAQTNVTLQTESLRIAKVQFNAGQTSMLDESQAQTQLGTTEATVPPLQSQLVEQKDALAVLLGTTPDQVDALLGSDATIPQAPSVVAVGMPKDLLRNRPDVQEAEYTAAAQSAQLGVAKAQLYPALSLSGTFGYESSDVPGQSLGDLFKWSHHTVSFGPSLQIPIFNYGQLTNQVRAQDSVFEQAILTYQNTVLQAQQEVQNAISSYEQALIAEATLTTATESALESSKLAMIRYRDGETDYTTVLTVEQQQLQVQNSLAQAQGNVPQALVSLYTALGGGWQISQGHDVVPDNIKSDMRARTNWGGLLAPDSHAAPSSTAQQIDQTYVPTW